MKLSVIYILFFILLLSACDQGKEKKLTWIQTTNSNRWVNQPAPALGEAQANDTVDLEVFPDKKHQEIDGFGGCFNEMGWEALKSLPEEMRDSVLRQLFDPQAGCRFNLCRMPIGASDFALEWYAHNDSAGDFEMKYFSIKRDHEYLIPYIKAAQKYCPDLKVWASPWSPPTWMKTNQHYACRMSEKNDLTCCEGKEGVDQFLMQAPYLKAYALYMAKFVEAYEKENIPITAIHVQNEPNSCQVFPSCIWTANSLATFIGQYLGPLFENKGLKTEIWYGTIERPYIEPIDSVLMDSAAKQYVAGLGFQWAGREAIPKAHEKYPKIRKMQTETICGDGSNDWAATDTTFGLLKHYFSNGANSYMYWNMILDENSVSRWGWPQNAMITINTFEERVYFNPEYYLMQHLSHFVEQGSHKIAQKGSWSDAIAFSNPDGSIIILLANRSQEEATCRVKVGDQRFVAALPPRSFNTFSIAE